MDSVGPLETITQAITGTYAVEQIEETSGSGGSYAAAIYRDSATYGWMCGPNGQPENPADYISQHNVSGAYANRGALRIRGTNAVASCWVSNPTGARVYSDNDIRTCIGYNSVFACTLGGLLGGPYTYEVVIWK